ncbi:MAG TPA: c-type cytochrome [Limnobacter sp.]|nr:c-type cytochrome [Limnobacter sp.]
MRKWIAGILAAKMLAVASPVQADLDMVRKYNCTACHQVDKKKYGPSFKQVAEKYAGDAGAVETLSKKIKQGGSGVWGKDPMPPQPQVTDADAVTIAKYVLEVK